MEPQTCVQWKRLVTCLCEQVHISAVSLKKILPNAVLY